MKSRSNEKPKHGLAVTSLVLGIVSVLCAGVVTGIPAIITGRLAVNRALRSPEQFGGARIAKAGSVLGYFSFVTSLIVLGLLLQTLAHVAAKASSGPCLNNLRQIGLAARIYANDHGGTLPGSLVQMSNELGSALFLVCPSDPKAPPRKLTARPITETDYLSYEWRAKPGEAGSDNSQNVLVRCRVDGNLLLGDGSVRRGSDKQ